MSHVWTEKYRPRTTEDIIGHRDTMRKINAWLSTWRRGNKPLLIMGPSGVGKTAIAIALAKERNLELVESGASDVRSKKNLQASLGESARQRSLFHKGKLILIDDVGETIDRGFLPELERTIKKTPFPTILTTGDRYNHRIKSLKKACHIVKLFPLSISDIRHQLSHIATSEHIDLSENQASAIASHAGGDLRAAINDMQSLTSILPKGPIPVDALASRDRTAEMQEYLTVVFKTTSFTTARSATWNVDASPEDLLLWTRENVAKEYRNPIDLANAYDYMAKADLFGKRVRRYQLWRLIPYMTTLLSAGVALAKNEKYPGPLSVQFPLLLMQIVRAKMSTAKEISLSKKLAPSLHTSAKRIRSDLPILSLIAQSTNLNETLELDDESWATLLSINAR